MLLETRTEAQKLAQQIARRADREGKDLYTAVAIERETQTYIDQMMRQRELVKRVEIRDRNGVLVYEGRSEARLRAGPAAGRPPSITPPVVGSPELERRSVPGVEARISNRVHEAESTFEVPDIQVPIGEYGNLQIAISPLELSKRIEVLRSDLIRQTGLIGISSMLLLISAYIVVWLVLRRSQRLEIQAAEAERLAYLGTLASGLAHEIRNPRTPSTSTCRCSRRRSTSTARPPPASACCRSPAPSSAASSVWSRTSSPTPSPARWSSRRSPRCGRSSACGSCWRGRSRAAARRSRSRTAAAARASASTPGR